MEDPDLTGAEREQMRTEFRAMPGRQALQHRLDELLADPDLVRVESWFVGGPTGVQLARAPEEKTVGDNYSWRSYFQGGNQDFPSDRRAGPEQHISARNLSAVYYSQVTDRWTVTISTPVYIDDEQLSQGGKPMKRFLGILAVSVNVESLSGYPGDSAGAVRRIGRLARRTEQRAGFATSAVRDDAGCQSRSAQAFSIVSPA